MEKLIKIGSQFLAITAFAALLVVNIQVGTTELGAESPSIEFSADVEESFAGPCANRGCNGDPEYCDEYNVVEIGDFKLTRTCDGSKSESNQPKQLEEN